jgi:hypothetical protein
MISLLYFRGESFKNLSLLIIHYKAIGYGIIRNIFGLLLLGDSDNFYNMHDLYHKRKIL